jgi:tetratricopeptide (TPR) repeat protein
MSSANLDNKLESPTGSKNDVGTSSELDAIAKQIDSSCDRKDADGLAKALNSVERYLADDPCQFNVSLLNYFAANAWGGLRRISRIQNNKSWEWQQPELEKEILCLRLAMQNPVFALLPAVRQCQIATNLGNTLSTIGRFVEAIEYWNRALKIDPSFTMALGNRGEAFFYYARALYDKHHQHILLRQSALDLRNALANDIAAIPGEHFRKLEATISQRLGDEYINNGDDLGSFSLGRTSAEREYRRWCLDQSLFLNPLNDLGEFPLAARDVFEVDPIGWTTNRVE